MTSSDHRRKSWTPHFGLSRFEMRTRCDCLSGSLESHKMLEGNGCSSSVLPQDVQVHFFYRRFPRLRFGCRCRSSEEHPRHTSPSHHRPSSGFQHVSKIYSVPLHCFLNSISSSTSLGVNGSGCPPGSTYYLLSGKYIDISVYGSFTD